MNIEKTFWITFVVVVLLAGFVGYLLHPCKCPELSNKKISNETIQRIDTADNAELRRIADSLLSN